MIDEMKNKLPEKCSRCRWYSKESGFCFVFLKKIKDYCVCKGVSFERKN